MISAALSSGTTSLANVAEISHYSLHSSTFSLPDSQRAHYATNQQPRINLCYPEIRLMHLICFELYAIKQLALKNLYLITA